MLMFLGEHIYWNNKREKRKEINWPTLQVGLVSPFKNQKEQEKRAVMWDLTSLKKTRRSKR